MQKVPFLPFQFLNVAVLVPFDLDLYLPYLTVDVDGAECEENNKDEEKHGSPVRQWPTHSHSFVSKILLRLFTLRKCI